VGGDDELGPGLELHQAPSTSMGLNALMLLSPPPQAQFLQQGIIIRTALPLDPIEFSLWLEIMEISPDICLSISLLLWLELEASNLILPALLLMNA